MTTIRPIGYEFADFKMDIERIELSHEQTLLRIEPKIFDLLLYLIENRHRAVTREELLQTIWEGNKVCYHALPQCIWRLRSLLGDHSRTTVQTIPRVGYRFGLTVRPVFIQRDEDPPLHAKLSREAPPLRLH